MMATVKFVRGATVYPDGRMPVSFRAGAEGSFEEDYAALLITKGQAVAVASPAPPASPAPGVAPAAPVAPAEPAAPPAPAPPPVPAAEPQAAPKPAIPFRL